MHFHLRQRVLNKIRQSKKGISNIATPCIPSLVSNRLVGWHLAGATAGVAYKPVHDLLGQVGPDSLLVVLTGCVRLDGSRFYQRQLDSKRNSTWRLSSTRNAGEHARRIALVDPVFSPVFFMPTMHLPGWRNVSDRPAGCDITEIQPADDVKDCASRGQLSGCLILERPFHMIEHPLKDSQAHRNFLDHQSAPDCKGRRNRSGRAFIWSKTRRAM